MNKFVRNLLTEWRKLALPIAGETFVVAVSGGADSVALALALAELKKRRKLNLRFVVAHFNHNLRGAESDGDELFVENFAQKLGLEFVSARGRLSKKGNLEQNARLARYGFLLDVAANFESYGILTAHTMNDQAETFLLNLIRGSGIDGLSGIKPVITNYKLQITNESADSSPKSEIRNPKSQTALIRPLLHWARREDTENFCRENEIDFREDAMNDDLTFRRVRVRKVLVPVLKDFNPKIIETLASVTKILQSARAHSNEIAAVDLDEEFLMAKDLSNLAPGSLSATLRRWIKARRGDLRQIDSKHINAIVGLIGSRKSGRVVELPGGESVVKSGGKLWWRKKNIDINREST